MIYNYTIEEWERSSYKFDYDNDEIPNFYDVDDDDDELPTSVELSVDLNPFNAADAHGDKDHDGLDNLWEYENGTMINDNDTDHDGIDDGAEFEYWQSYLYNLWDSWVNEETGAEVNETSLSYCRIPDVDNDSIPDGKEINGYEVKIITGWKSDGTPISEMRTVDSPYLDPLIPYGYNSTEGMEWSDVDDDGIPDVVENLLSNSSRFLDFYNFTHKDDWMKDYRLALWENYSWAIAYYFAIKLQRKWAVVYNNLESNPKYWIVHYNSANAHNKSCEENATNYLSSQFNPMVVENMAPVILKFNVKFYYYVLTAMVDVHTLIYDCGGVKYVKIKNSDFGQIVEWSGVENIVEIDHTFWASPWGANLGVNITVIAKDLRGNKVEVSKQVYGPIGKLIHLFLQWLGKYFRFLVKIAKMVADAVNFIVEWIIEQVKNIILAPINALFSTIQGWRENVINAVKMYVSEYINNNGQVSESTVEYARRALDLTWFFFIVLGVVIALNTAIMFAEGVTFGAATIIFHVVIPLIVIVMVKTFMHTKEYETKSIGMPTSVSFNYLLNMVKNYILGGSKRETRDATAIWDIIFNGLASLAGLVGWCFLLISLDEAGMGDITGSVYATAGVATGLLSWLVFGVAATSFAPIQPWGDVFGILAMTFGAASMYFGMKATKGSTVPKILGVIGTTIGLISLALGIEGLSFVPP